MRAILLHGRAFLGRDYIPRSGRIRALKRRLGESASPKGLIASFRTRVVAEPAPSLRSGQALQGTGARADLRAVMAEISEQVKVLDGVVRYRFGDNAELMGGPASTAWWGRSGRTRSRR